MLRSSPESGLRDLELKEHITFDCKELFPSGLHPRAGATIAARACARQGRTDGMAPSASSVFLAEKRGLFTFTLKPRTAVECSYFYILVIKFTKPPPGLHGRF